MSPIAPYQTSSLRNRLRGTVLLPAGLALILGACSATPTLYKRQPVAPDGTALPVEAASALIFEDGSFVEFGPQEELELVDGIFRLRGGHQGPWAASTVDQLEIEDSPGEHEMLPVATPEDLLRVESPPRLRTIELMDGELISIENSEDWRWTMAGDGILLLGKKGVELRRLDFSQIAGIEIYRGDLLGSTLKSPAFWIAGGVAAGLYILVQKQADSGGLAVD